MEGQKVKQNRVKTQTKPNGLKNETEKNQSKIKENKLNENKIKEIKNKYAENVSMTADEYAKLINSYGKEFVDQCIYVLDNYKGASGKNYKSDYKAILSWVIEKVKSKPPPTIKRKFSSYEQRNYENLDDLYANGGG